MKSALWRLFGRKGMIPENSSLKQIVLWKMSVRNLFQSYFRTRLNSEGKASFEKWPKMSHSSI